MRELIREKAKEYPVSKGNRRAKRNSRLRHITNQIVGARGRVIPEEGGS